MSLQQITGAEETPVQKYQRLQLEINELADMVNRTKVT